MYTSFFTQTAFIFKRSYKVFCQAFYRRVRGFSFILAALCLAFPLQAQAQGVAEIDSVIGPIKRIGLTATGHLYAYHKDFSYPLFMGANSDSAAAWFIYDETNNVLYGPPNVYGASSLVYTPWTSVPPIEGPLGVGNDAAPHRVGTTVTMGSGQTALTAHIDVTYEDGTDGIYSTIRIMNPSGGDPRNLRVFSVADMYFRASTSITAGVFDATTGALGGTVTGGINTGFSGWIMPVTSASKYFSGSAASMWSQIGTQRDLDNTVSSGSDYASALQWAVTGLASGSSTSIEKAYAFSKEILLLPSVLPPGTGGVAYSTALSPVGGGASPSVALVAGSVPGLSFNPGNNTLSGTPTTPGIHRLLFRVTDGGTTKDFLYRLVIKSATPTTFGATMATLYSSGGVANGPFHLYLTCNGEVMPCTTGGSGTCNNAVTPPRLELDRPPTSGGAGENGFWNTRIGDFCTLDVQPGGAVASGYRLLAGQPAEGVITGSLAFSIQNEIAPDNASQPTRLELTKAVTGDIADRIVGHSNTNNPFSAQIYGCNRSILPGMLDGQKWLIEFSANSSMTCNVSESAPGGAGSNHRYETSISPTSFALLAGETFLVNIENKIVKSTDTLRTITITNAVSGAPGDITASGYNNTNKTFDVLLDCGSGYTTGFRLIEGQAATYQVLQGRECRVETTSSPELPSSSYAWYTHTSSPSSPFTVGGANIPLTVTHDIQSASKRAITVAKTVIDEGGGYNTGGISNGRFPITVNCTGQQPVTLNLAHNESAVVDTSAGETCTVTETVPSDVINPTYYNSATISPGSFTVVGQQRVEVTNHITQHPSDAKLIVTKKVVGTSGANKGVAHDPNTIFPIAVDCATGFNGVLNLKDGDSATIEGRHLQSCVLMENVPAANAGYQYEVSYSPYISILEQGDNFATVENKTVTQFTDHHIVTLQNKVEGDTTNSGFDALSVASFNTKLDCGQDYVWETSMVAEAFAQYSVAAGRQCTLTTEAAPVLNPGYVFVHTHTPTNGVFTVNARTEAQATHTITSSAVVQKTVIDETPSSYVDGKFDITVTCNGTSTQLSLADGESGSAVGQPGDVCTVTEATPDAGVIGNGNTNMATITPSTFVMGSGGPATVTNRIVSGVVPKGSLTVTKTVTGTLAGHDPAAVFGITVTCGGVVSTLNLKDGESATVEAELGSACTIAEP
ncbi:MAG: hypothetical protein LBE32_02795, partial [Burkholderiales bacterium]|nr:hypothetical protein [Burkholderiales bacterium]